MSFSLGAREIYNYATTDEQWCEVVILWADDSPSVVSRFISFYQKGGVEKFKKTDNRSKNILMEAAFNANVHLVEYIVQHAKPKVLNLRDSEGNTVLHQLVKSPRRRGQVIACAHRLLAAGADMNARGGVNGDGPDPLGYLIQKMRAPQSHLGNMSKMWKSLIELFVIYKATHAYIPSGESSKWKSIHDIDELKSGWERVGEKFWLEARLYAIGIADQNSTLSQLPIDIQRLIFQNIWMSTSI